LIARSNLAILPHTASEHVSAALKISMVYLMTLSVTLDYIASNDWIIVNDELGMMWKEMVKA
jgi:hypothetical protein